MMTSDDLHVYGTRISKVDIITLWIILYAIIKSVYDKITISISIQKITIT